MTNLLETLTEALEGGMKAIPFNKDWQAYESGNTWDGAIDYNGGTLEDIKREFIRNEIEHLGPDMGRDDEEFVFERARELVGAWILDGKTFNILDTGHQTGAPRRDIDWEHHNMMMLYFASKFAIKTITA